jgi:hypothetical protein
VTHGPWENSGQKMDIIVALTPWEKSQKWIGTEGGHPGEAPRHGVSVKWGCELFAEGPLKTLFLAIFIKKKF